MFVFSVLLLIRVGQKLAKLRTGLNQHYNNECRISA
jgi:hypothetical protein